MKSLHLIALIAALFFGAFAPTSAIGSTALLRETEFVIASAVDCFDCHACDLADIGEPAIALPAIDTLTERPTQDQSDTIEHPAPDTGAMLHRLLALIPTRTIDPPRLQIDHLASDRLRTDWLASARLARDPAQTGIALRRV